MYFEGMCVPGAEWVEVVHIREKDGSPLSPENWRHKLFGRISLCWIGGGLRERNAFFRGRIRINDGKITEWDLENMRWTSTTTAQPVEIDPGIFDFETNTCIYRFRIISDEEENIIKAKFTEIAQARLTAISLAAAPSAGKDIPVS